MRKLMLIVAMMPFLCVGTARADDFFSAVTILNQTSDRITYTMTFGPAGSRTVTLFPGQGENHWEMDRVYTPVITYAPNVNRPGTVQETLQFRIQSSNQGGKTYGFRQTPGDRSVYLIPLN